MSKSAFAYYAVSPIALKERFKLLYFLTWVVQSLHAANKELLNDIANNMKEVEGGQNDLPVSFKPTTCHYMAAMESAKANFCPQIRTESEESPRKHQKQLSFTGADQQARLPLPNPSFKNHVSGTNWQIIVITYTKVASQTLIAFLYSS